VNSAGATHDGADGICIEEGHIDLHGEAWAIGRFEAQRDLWEASPDKFGAVVLNISWNWPLNIFGLVYRGTDA
jgi:hypothetical protein